MEIVTVSLSAARQSQWWDGKRTPVSKHRDVNGDSIKQWDGACAHLIWGRRPSDVLPHCWRADRCSGGDSETLQGDSMGLQQHWKRAQHKINKIKDVSLKEHTLVLQHIPYCAVAITFYRALAAASPSPVLHRCWPAASETSDHLPDCR